MSQVDNIAAIIPKTSPTGRIIHAYFRAGKIILPLLKILILIALVATVLVLTCPQFAMNREFIFLMGKFFHCGSLSR